ncbi:hypothetical protein HK098_001089 [Nowakowskiella sp. JEL0407]|nr:hypothetical protein HK098_001089 [Nowakowskiella sp. JEL0407]
MSVAKKYIPTWFSSPKNLNNILENNILVHLKQPIGSILFAQKNPPYFVTVQWTLYHEYLDSFVVFILAAVGSLIAPKKRMILYFSSYLTAHIYNVNFTPDFILGLIIAEISELGVFEVFMKSKNRTVKIIPAILALLCPITFMLIDRFIEKVRLQAHISVAFLSLALELSPALQHFFSLPFSVFLGQISFGLYLLHPILLFSICTSLVPYVVVKPYERGSKIPIHVYLETFAMMMAVFFYFSWIFYKTVDLWSVRVGYMIEGYFFDNKSPFPQLKGSVKDNLEMFRLYIIDMTVFWWDLVIWCWVKWVATIFSDLAGWFMRILKWLLIQVQGSDKKGSYLPTSNSNDKDIE